ncbi:hypothetical protein WA026_011489 [Henosepilachna vigintioctopunctata]|uniref:Uncharacterized protein n=1 Tax=Henosepilachna vigintioctopunctata TaxID=420089 RepID=A0AAW1TJN0_9CUCU
MNVSILKLILPTIPLYTSKRSETQPSLVQSNGDVARLTGYRHNANLTGISNMNFDSTFEERRMKMMKGMIMKLVPHSQQDWHCLLGFHTNIPVSNIGALGMIST